MPSLYRAIVYASCLPDGDTTLGNRKDKMAGWGQIHMRWVEKNSNYLAFKLFSMNKRKKSRTDCLKFYF